MELAREPRSFLERGPAHLDVLQPPEGFVGPTEFGSRSPSFGLNADQQHDREGHGQDVAARNEPTVGARVERGMELAEGGEDQPHRQEAVPHGAGAAVVPAGQLGRQHEEPAPEQVQTHAKRSRRRRHGLEARPGRQVGEDEDAAQWGHVRAPRTGELDDREKSDGGPEQDQPVVANPDAPKRDRRAKDQKRGSNEVSGRCDLRLGLARHVQPEVRNGHVQPSHDEEQAGPTGDCQNEEGRRLKEGHGGSDLAVADPGDDGHAE